MAGTHTKVAAGISLVALGSVAGYAVGGGPGTGQDPVNAEAKRRPVEIRTKTIRRTIHVVRHEKPKPQPSAPVAPAPPVAAAVAGTPVAPAPQASVPPPAASQPVRTRTSGSTRGGERDDRGTGEHESEARDD
jgi:hypothetical protein